MGHSISIVLAVPEIDYEYGGTTVVLDRKTLKSSGVWYWIKKLFVLRRYLENGEFDLIIEGRFRSSWFREMIRELVVYRKQQLLYLVHSYKIKNYIFSSRHLVNLIYRNSSVFVAVSEGIKNRIESQFEQLKVFRIYNTFVLPEFVSDEKKIKKVLPENYILFYGRIVDEVKNISFLLNGYEKSILREKGVKLIILGSGPDKGLIQAKVDELKLNSFVIFEDYIKNPFWVVQKALFSVLTSNYEGFPMVLVESLTLGTPVVAVDCKSGPSEVIETGYNGILSPLHNEEKFVTALNKMMLDKDFYHVCKKNAQESVAKFNESTYRVAWGNLLKKITV